MRRHTVMTTVAVLALVAAAAVPAAARETGTRGSAFARILPHYEAIHQALASDTLEGVAEHARAIRRIAARTAKAFSPQRAGVAADRGQECRSLLPDVERAADRLAKARTLEAAREAFGDLSRPLVRYREMATGERPYVVYCPMAKKPWLQESRQIANPYFGSKMPKCGQIVSE